MILKAYLYNGVFHILKLRVLLGVLFVVGPSYADQQITAQWVETRLKDTGVSRTYAGQVAFVDSLKGLQIRADSAVVHDETYLFISNLSYRDSVRTIQAQKLTYDAKLQVAKFYGQVLLKDGPRQLYAQQISVWPKTETLIAKDHAFFEYPSQHIWAQKLIYESQTDVGKAIGNVRATLLGDENDSLSIYTDSLTFVPKEKQFAFFNGVQISQSGMALTALFGHYQRDSLHTFGDPKIVWSQINQADSIRAQADSMVLVFDEERLQTVHLLSQAKISLTGNRDSINYIQKVQGDSAVVEVEKNEMAFLSVFRNVKIEFQKQNVDINIEGDTVVVWFDNGDMDSMVVTGQSTGTYQESGEGISHMSGEKKILSFEGHELKRVLILGHAMCTYQSEDHREGNAVDVGGDTLKMSFDAGSLTQIDANGSVKGVYMQEKTENRP